MEDIHVPYRMNYIKFGNPNFLSSAIIRTKFQFVQYY